MPTLEGQPFATLYGFAPVMSYQSRPRDGNLALSLGFIDQMILLGEFSPQ